MLEGTLSFLHLSTEFFTIGRPRECSELVVFSLAHNLKGNAEGEGSDCPVVALREDEGCFFAHGNEHAEVCDMDHGHMRCGQASPKLLCGASLAGIMTLKKEHANCRELPLPEERARTFPETYARVEPRNEEEHMPRPSLALLR